MYSNGDMAEGLREDHRNQSMALVRSIVGTPDASSGLIFPTRHRSTSSITISWGDCDAKEASFHSFGIARLLQFPWQGRLE